MANPDPLLIRRSTSEPEIAPQNPSHRRTLTLDFALSEDRLKDKSRASPYYSGLYFRSFGASPSRDNLSSSSSLPRSSASAAVRVAIQEWVPFWSSKNKKAEAGGGEDLPKIPEGDPQNKKAEAAACEDLPKEPEGDPQEEQQHQRAESSCRSRLGASSSRRKPLRESDSPQAAPPVQPAVVVAAAAVSGDDGLQKEREYVWAYKYRPRFLADFICHTDQIKELQEMVGKQQCSHLIFEGPPGVGKRTMVLAFLRDMLGSQKLKTKNELRKIKLKEESVTSIDVNLRTSSQHVEVNLSELRGYEKHVIVSLINESRAPSNKPLECDPSNSRAIVLHEADRLSSDALHYICWIMEKYNGCNKLFFCCYDASKLQAIKHLCKLVKLQPPSDSEIVDVLEFIAKKEHIELPHHLAERIANNSKHNLRQAIRSFEASWNSNHSVAGDDDILTGWEDDIANIAKSIVKEQSPRQLYIIRGKLKNLIEHDVSPDFIFSTLILEMKKLLAAQFHEKVDAMYQGYKVHDTGPVLNPAMSVALAKDRQDNSSHKLNNQRKNVQYFMKIEEFAAKFMSFYKSATTTGIGGCITT